ncbi:Jerky protein homolog-like [Eumeta japonica]|uniref:Jerky protein homolog-like n=1 Tax=Eumeta variegata TaxID=151549 RepID=A0A4C1ZZC5_EUMVA|nr:Jerky protein homolog-like [Eumeta japonica]
MVSKRKRVVLSLADKLKIIEQLDKGVTGKKLSEIYGVGQATISDIKTASNGWLRNFKFRHGVRELDLAGEKLSADSAAAENFIEKFKTASESYDPRNLVPWTCPGHNPGHKVSKERVTVLNCANSTGNHKLPLLLIGKSRNPRAFKKKTSLFYKSQPKAWMTAALFTEWYDEVFIPEVKKHQKSVEKKAAEAWSLVTPVTLRRAWNKLKGLPSEKNKKKESEENEKQEYGEDDDDEDALSLEEIRKMIVKFLVVQNVREDVEVEVEELSADVEVDAGPSASEAFAGLETALKWMERQPECDHLQLLNVKRMRDLTARNG